MTRPRTAMVLTLTAVVVVSLAGSSLGQSASPADEKVTFTVGVTGDLNSANPFRQIDTTEAFVFGLMYDGILRLGQADYSTQPELLESYDTSEDGLTWTFVLRDDITWSDGEPITADDFVWTANFVIENDISSWSDGYTFTDEIRAVDERTIEWTTTRPTLVPGLPGYSLILPEHIWGDMTTREIRRFRNFPNSVGSGPYTLEEWEPGEFWRLEARPDYYHGAPHIDEIVFRVYNSDEAAVQALIKGDIDHTVVATAGLFERLKEEDPNKIGTAVTSAEAFHQLSFNIVDDPNSTAHPAVKDRAVREAVAWAIDRQTLIERVLRGYGEPGTTPVVPLYDFWHWEPPDEDRIGFDPEEANRLLDEAGYLDADDDGVREMPGGGDPLRWRLFVATTDPQAINAAPFIQGWLRDIGIESSVRSMTDSKLYDQWYGFDWDLILYSWGVGPDPDFILSSFTSRQCGYWSDTCYANEEYDQLYREQQTTLDADARQGIVHEMQQILYQDIPEIVLWYPSGFEAWRADRWTGFLRWPEPDGDVFWENTYSALNVRPVGDAESRSAADSGLPAAVWIGAIAVVIAAIGGVVLARRRRDEHYAA